MKNIIISTIIFLFVIMCPKAYANQYIKAEMTGFPTVNENSVSANINLIYMQLGISRLFVTASDSFIVNNEDLNIKIPVNNLYLLCDGQEFQISNNGWQRFYIDPLDITGSAQKNVNLRLENTGELPSGTYTILLRFLNRTAINLDYECDFLFTFVIDEKHSLTSFSGDPTIVLTEENIFNKQSFIRNQNDIRVDLTSNTKWKLWLATGNLDNKDCEYYFQIKNVSGKVSNYEQNNTQLFANRRYLLASGEPTLDGIDTGNKVPSNITIEYSFKNTDSDNFIKEGIRQNQFTYILERE